MRASGVASHTVPRGATHPGGANAVRVEHGDAADHCRPGIGGLSGLADSFLEQICAAGTSGRETAAAYWSGGESGAGQAPGGAPTGAGPTRSRSRLVRR